LQRLVQHYPKAIWINPTPEKYWDTSQSARIIKQEMEDRMFGLTLEGLDAAMLRLMR
jgi:uncharacterized protein with von Willebrand factor type A (vWA) domain